MSSPQAHIEYYTDPLCCWCWGFEPQWRRLRYELASHITWRYRMGGMLPGWDRYHDPINAVTRPLQMGPVWMQARQVTGMDMDDRVWLHDPPASSYPACLAVKAAEQQSPEAGEHCLRRLREAVMMEGRNIASSEVLEAVGEDVAEALPGAFDVAHFLRDLEMPEAAGAFREDIRQARYLGIGRFPALTIKGADGPGVIAIGYRPYEALLEAVTRVWPDAPSLRRRISLRTYRKHWGRLIERELREVAPKAKAAPSG